MLTVRTFVAGFIVPLMGLGCGGSGTPSTPPAWNPQGFESVMLTSESGTCANCWLRITVRRPDVLSVEDVARTSSFALSEEEFAGVRARVSTQSFVQTASAPREWDCNEPYDANAQLALDDGSGVRIVKLWDGCSGTCGDDVIMSVVTELYRLKDEHVECRSRNTAYCRVAPELPPAGMSCTECVDDCVY